MTLDTSFIERNRASTQRMREMAARQSDEALRTPVGQHWTVAIVFAHLAFWDRRVLHVLEKSEQDGKVYRHQSDGEVNDYILPLLYAIPPREAARLAVETAELLDRRLEALSPALVEEINAYNPRWVDRSLHRGEHLNEAEAALKA